MNKNHRIHCKITRKSTQRIEVFYFKDENKRITKENKTRVYAMWHYGCLSIHAFSNLYL